MPSPLALDTQSLALLFTAALVGGVVRGFAGFGGPMVFLPFATSVLGPSAAVWVVIAVDIVVSARFLPAVRGLYRSHVVLPLGIGTLVTLPLGTWALVSLDAVVMRRVICAAILLAALIMLTGWRWRRELARWQWIAVGAVAGLVLGITSLAVTAALFLQSGKTTAAEARADFMVWVFVVNIALLVVIAAQAGMPTGLWPAMAASAPAYFVGMAVGTAVYGRLSDATGRRLVLTIVAVNALVGLLR
jgi:hypothetical protein